MKRFLSVLLIVVCAAAVVLYPRGEYIPETVTIRAEGTEPDGQQKEPVFKEETAFASEPTPVPTPTPSPSPSPTPVPTSAPSMTVTPAPEVTPRIVTVNALYEGITDTDGSKDVIRLQVRLSELGYLFGEMDGKFGAETAQAIRFFQQVNGLEATGVADFRTLDAVYAKTAVNCPGPTATPLMNGASGDEVIRLQQMLTLYGFLGGDADGTFGAKTESAVEMAKTYVYEVTREQWKIHPTPAPAPTDPWMTPTPTPQITPMLTVNPYTGAQEEITDFIPTPTPSVRPAPTAAPFKADGNADDELISALMTEDFIVYRMDVKNGDKNDEVKRVQNRLVTLGYMRSSDGAFGGKTERALKYFQYRNNLPQTGTADKRTQQRMFCADAVKSDTVVTEYKITVNTSKQRVYVYKWNGAGFDSSPVKTFKCSSGLNETPTPKGTFWNTGRISEWYYFKDFDCWAKYAWTINGGILFHSVIYSSRSDSSVRAGTIKALGKKASHGCVRLSVADAKWIYENCAAGTPVTVE